MQLCEFAKRLLMANQLGIRIEHQDGHRWLLFQETDTDGICAPDAFDTVYWRRTGNLCPSKVYGSAADALDLVDRLLGETGKLPLLEQYQKQYGGNPEQAWGFERCAS